MPGPEFFQTKMGQRFYQSTMPRIAEALEKLANNKGIDPSELTIQKLKDKIELLNSRGEHEIAAGIEEAINIIKGEE